MCVCACVCVCVCVCACKQIMQKHLVKKFTKADWKYILWPIELSILFTEFFQCSIAWILLLKKTSTVYMTLTYELFSQWTFQSILYIYNICVCIYHCPRSCLGLSVSLSVCLPLSLFRSLSLYIYIYIYIYIYKRSYFLCLSGRILDLRFSQPGFDFSFRNLACLATMKSSDTRK